MEERILNHTVATFVEASYRRIYDEALLLLESRSLCCICEPEEIMELEQILSIVEKRLKKIESRVDIIFEID